MNGTEHIYSKIKAIIKQGEGLTVEFKECKTALNFILPLTPQATTQATGEATGEAERGSCR